MRSIRPITLVLLLGLLACGEKRPGSTVSDTTQDRPDTANQRRPNPADTVNGASPEDTLNRPRPLGMRRAGDPAMRVDSARQDSARQDSTPKPQ